MFTKGTITLAALIIAGATTAAVAYEDPENKIGDRYPALEQQYQSVATKNTTRVMSAPKHQKLDQYINEDVESKIGDRYPLLEQPIRTTSVTPKGTAFAKRTVLPFTYADKKEFDLQSSRVVF